MAFPVGVTTRSVVFSDVIDAEDGTEPVLKTRIIVASNDILIHTGTGRILLPTPQIYTAAPSLPVTDQAGVWTDQKGKALVSPTHSYRIDMEYQNNLGVWVPVKSWPKLYLITSGGSFDLDTYFDGLTTNYSG